MADDNRDKWYRLPKLSFNKRTLTSRMRKVEGATIRHAHKFIFKRWSSVREVQWHIVIWILAMGVLIAATGLQLMWYQQSYRTMAPARDGTYAEAVLGPVDTLNPLFASTSAERSSAYLMFSSLLQYDKTGHLNYDLATDVKISDANTVYTVSIRPDVKWHDGVQLTAKDIAFTISLMKNPNVRTAISGWKDIIVKVIDDKTISFKLPAIYAAFEHALTFPIVPEHILGGIAPSSIRENAYSQNPVGSGPFKLNFIQNVTASAGRKVVYMARNNDYYGGVVNLARFQLHVYNTSDEIIHALTLSEVNAAADLSPADISVIDKKRYAISSQPIQSGVYAIINTKSATLKDVAIRRALRLATNTNAIRETLPDTTKPLELPFTEGQLTGNIPKAPEFNLTTAKKVLTDDGWKLNSNGLREKAGKQLKLSVVTMKDTEFEHVLDVLSGQWRTLGITIDTHVLDPNDVTQNVVQNILQPRNFDVLLYQYNIGADLDVYAYWHSSQATPQGSNFSNYSNVISDEALTSARSRVEPTLRNAKYITFAKQWLNDIPAIALYQSTAQYVTSNNVHSFSNTDKLITPIDRYSDVLDWSAGTRSVYKTP